MLTKIYNKIFGTSHENTIKKLQPIVVKINDLEEKYEKFSDDKLKAKTEDFKTLLEKGKTLDDILPDAFAVVREASKRTLGLRHFDVQMIGGIVLHQGNIAEMKTGEGKTLVATLAAYLNSLSGNSVYIVTVNDYLASRDAQEMGVIYEFLGLTTSFIIHGQSPLERKECYKADVIYATNNELGFDYLRDNMATNFEQVVQAKLSYAIIDEVDSILIDEARTPLIISAPAEESTNRYVRYSSLIPRLERDTHYTVDEKSRSVLITDEGVSKMEELLGMKDIYTEAGFNEVHHIEQALKAHALFKIDVDYVVKDGEIVIVDEFTGRLTKGRRYSDGLHQAIEAKERVEVKRESKTLASITFQNFFRLFDKLAGMTGTAETEAEEFYQIYALDTVIIPTNEPIVRDDKSDVIYKTLKGKFQAITKIVKEKQLHGQPVLVGTNSIEASEVLSKMFEKFSVRHNVLNAKKHEKEAEIVTKAGQKGMVTIATNMAGRGTDIKLGEGVTDLGGLAILGSERHDSRRIDNQLRGRSGRQGDAGESQFFVSMEDDIMRLFGGEKLKGMMNMMKVPEDMPIENKMISKSIETAQRKIESYNFDTRKHVLEYDDVLDKQRRAIYKRRRNVLKSESVSADIKELIVEESKSIVSSHLSAETNEFELKDIEQDILRITKTEIDLKDGEQEQLESQVLEHLKKCYEAKKEEVQEKERFIKIEKALYLRSIDSLWMEHIDNITNLRNNVSLYGYGQRNPLMEFKKEAYYLYVKLISGIQKGTLQTLFHIAVVVDTQIEQRKQVSLKTNNQEIEGNLQGGLSVLRQPNQRASAPVVATTKTAERNDPCPCGSGKKYKKCCGR